MLLTQSQVNGLEDGTRIMVIWGGGKEPHECTVKTLGGLKRAVSINAPHDTGHILTMVGEERYQTRVWLSERQGSVKDGTSGATEDEPEGVEEDDATTEPETP